MSGGANRMRKLALGGCLVVGMAIVAAQEPAKDQFEVATVKAALQMF